MSRKLNRSELVCLVQADRHGQCQPMSKDQLDACNRLVGLGLLGENDNAPGHYWITSTGERELIKGLALVRRKK